MSNDTRIACLMPSPRLISACLWLSLIAWLPCAHASGSYNATLPSQAQQYTYGKAVFYARGPFADFKGCARCHKTDNRLSHKRLKSFGLDLEHYKAHCNSQADCASNRLEPAQWQALLHYLKTRYRLQ